MTGTEMKDEFLILYDKITNFDSPGYLEDEISIFLTKGQERVFFSLYNSLKNKVQEGFEETELRRKDIKELVKGVVITTPSIDQTLALPNGTLFTLPDDFMYTITEEIITTSTDVCKNNKRIRVKPITHDEYAINVKNPFKKPNILSAVWRVDYQEQQHEIITDGTFAVDSYHLRYIERLTPVILGAFIIDGILGPQDCKFDTSLHKRIVEEAVRIATGVTTPELYQIKTIEQQLGES